MRNVGRIRKYPLETVLDKAVWEVANMVILKNSDYVTNCVPEVRQEANKVASRFQASVSQVSIRENYPWVHTHIHVVPNGQKRGYTLSMYVNLVSDWYNCPICNGPTMPIFMVHDDLWKSVAKEHVRRAICWSCFEKLLGRRITVNDLKPSPPCNWGLIERLKKGQVITTKGI